MVLIASAGFNKVGRCDGAPSTRKSAGDSWSVRSVLVSAVDMGRSKGGASPVQIDDPEVSLKISFISMYREAYRSSKGYVWYLSPLYLPSSRLKVDR
jgi:hypothetical protein